MDIFRNSFAMLNLSLMLFEIRNTHTENANNIVVPT